MQRWVKFFGHGLFWSWNLLFVLVLLAGFLPLVGPWVVEGFVEDQLPWDFVAFSVLLLAVPPATLVLAFGFFRQNPRALLGLLFAVEGPLFLLCLLRLFAIHELNPGAAVVMWGVTFGAAVYVAEAFAAPVLGSHRWRWSLALGAASFSAFFAAYLALLAAFYVLPVAFLLIKELLSFEWASPLLRAIVETKGVALVLGTLGLLLFLYSATLFVLTPALLPWLHLGAVRRLWRQAQAALSRRAAGAVTLGGAALAALVFFVASQQPQRQVLSRLEAPPPTREAMQALIEDSSELREGLVRAYLGSYQYALNSSDEHVAEMYRDRDGFAMELETARVIQGWFREVASPFVYKGDFQEDHPRAATHYEQLFDQPIQKAERARIRHALTSNLRRDEVSAGLLNINEERAEVVQQSLQVTEHGDLAELELHEVYENLTTDLQEIYFAFSLPPQAALTGLWLGTSEDREQRDVYRVAPRGAAQRAYQAEVARRIDPALLEQVGPRQFRLRVFPIPARPAKSSGEPTPQLHLWMTWTTLADGDQWPAPELLERRNVRWSSKLVRRVNGRGVRGDTWIPSLPRESTAAPAVHLAALTDGTVVEARPRTPRQGNAVEGKTVAVIVDQSRSMARVREAFDATLKELRALEERGAKVRVFLARPANRPDAAREVPLAAVADEVLFYGRQTVQQMLHQWAARKDAWPADLVLLLTDDDAEARDSGDPAPPRPTAPFWLVHLGGLPREYDDATLDLLQLAGNGATRTVEDAVARWSQPVDILAVGGAYEWRRVTTADGRTPEPAFAPLAARALITARPRGEALSVEELDQLHSLARAHSVVTPWSSMIVLLRDRMAVLEEEERSEERFRRNHESGSELLNQPSGVIATTGVPEPEEWALILAGLAFLAFMLRRREPVLR
ncbi:TIGR02921 family PEP-CTERM protein [Pyxidicoccus xibeiensis]|uniref:TIGR02921 family PEP-CTERM protein n=1 Tax=Pyxidicoccus xibeiensis TaxID=2906759 RepID=UPI0020A7C23D|nr:TIGR02921 family PEP-CTERM protein [Pyxidicoccus xibeiensis]MCP3143208.1 TIGR02921 family PEP-CTERM protein [Pyxidicoccus xibeiensis]